MPTVSNYKHVMYLSKERMKYETLTTGDVIELTTSDLRKFLEHNTMKSLIKQFDKDKKDRPKFWAILNKACDMAHKDNQKFTTNLFLCPLQGLREQIRRGPLKRIRYIETNKSPAQKFKGILETDIKKETSKSLKKIGAETDQEFGKRKQTEVQNSLSPVYSYVEQIKKEDDPTDFEIAIIGSASSNEEVQEYFKGLFKSNPWCNYLKDYKRIQRSSSLLILKENAFSAISKLCNNQLESDGLFFYEPHPKLLKKSYDLAYVIEFEDLLTLKIKEKFQASGELVKFLEDKRILSLKPLFSSRLQNMMGVYFSKIGTDDILSQNVLNLYENYFKKDMFLSVNDYKSSDP